jgi:xylulokinase
VAALDAAGRTLALARAGYPLSTDATGRAEQSPDDWTRAVDAAMVRLAALTALGAVRGIGLAGQVPSLVAVGAKGPLGPAITWMDARADAYVARRLDRRARRALYRTTGMPVDGRYVGPMYAVHYGTAGRRPGQVLSAKDYLYLWLTGEAYTDPSTAAGFAAYRLRPAGWADDLLALWGLSPEQVPAVVAPGPNGPRRGAARPACRCTSALPIRWRPSPARAAPDRGG